VGSVFVTEVVGSTSNVIGLPLEAVRRLLAAR
jgi:predicted house-cleaning NTP pyrophosphatase (Maf/HAM1 superfamily)